MKGTTAMFVSAIDVPPLTTSAVGVPNAVLFTGAALALAFLGWDLFWDAVEFRADWATYKSDAPAATDPEAHAAWTVTAPVLALRFIWASALELIAVGVMAWLAVATFQLPWF